MAPERPETRKTDAAHQLLVHVAAKHGLANLRQGDPGEGIVEVDAGRTSVDVISFEDEAQLTMTSRPDVVPAGAADAEPGRPIGKADTDAA